VRSSSSPKTRFEGGLGAHALRDGERAVDAAPEEAPQGPGRDGSVVRVLHLAEDLRLAEHHRVERRGHAEDVAHGLFGFFLVEHGVEVGLADAAALGEDLAHGLEGARAVDVGVALRPRHHLDAVARREEHHLVELVTRRQSSQHFFERGSVARESLANFDGGCAEGESNDDDHARIMRR